MKNRKLTLRTCVVTKEKLEKKDLIRIVKNNEGKVFVDTTYKANGRGAYIKKDKDVLDKAIKTKILDRQLDTNISDEIYDEIRKLIER